MTKSKLTWQQKCEVLSDFTMWTGGELPSSELQVQEYVEAAIAVDFVTDEAAVIDYLTSMIE
jgi:hypothetical protein